jgi:hypothetical protein
MFDSCNAEEPDIIVDSRAKADKNVILDSLLQPNSVTIIHTSDTHNLHTTQEGRIPNGDIYIHSGDFTFKRMNLLQITNMIRRLEK